MKDGTILFNIEPESEDEDDNSNPKEEKTKKIAKEPKPDRVERESESK